jgi:hypothetical protein
MPSEVELALRGSGYRAPFDPSPPAPTLGPVSLVQVRSASAAAVGDFAQQAGAVLDMVARYSWPMAKGGGLGAHELGRLAEVAVVERRAARLTLELADYAGLLSRRRGSLEVSDSFADWRAADTGHRYAVLLKAWSELPFAPSSSSSAKRKAIRPLERQSYCLPGDDAREALVLALATFPAHHATSLPTLLTRLRWSRPKLRALEDSRLPSWETAWAEAETLGLLAYGVLTEVGRALAHATTEELAPLVADLAPADSERAIFGSDLTATVIGPPTARVSLLLDSTADRESSGAAVSWRFSPSSVRRAFDDGADIATLTAHLGSITDGTLPQPLHYLLQDVARRHGELRLSAHGTLLRGEDAVLMAQVAGDRALHKLGLRLLAPTILTSRVSLDETLAALRKGGYFPIPEGDPAEWIQISDAC